MMIGINQIDLVKGIARVLDSCPKSVASQLRKNIIVVGGGSQIPGFGERLTRDLISESPTGSTVKVSVGKGGAQGAYLGMQYIAKY
jgi:actin-related protein 6